MRIAFWYAPVLVLGPGRRCGVWLQGCSRGCSGCMATSFQPPDGGYVSDPLSLGAAILQSCKDNLCEGVTISGGEPFEQAAELKILLEYLNQAGIRDILIYSGFAMSGLLKKFPWIAALCACVVDGHFDINQPTEDGWRGSANQSCSLFRRLPGYDKWLKDKKGLLQTALLGNNIYIVGIPRIGDADILTGKANGTDTALSKLRP